ncbi:MAG: GNAT family N-acetyltransferase [Oscillospiraceae bacterium]|nr:GNAT family N-acetyltransferase [Oscillospiraceae bacterium]
MIIPVDTNNLKEYVDLAMLLFPDEEYKEEYEMYKESFKTDKEMGYLYQADNKYVGMMHISVRSDYVNGTDTSPVLFLEAIYVLPDYRKKGVARKFIEFAENIAKEKEITQLASDCLLENTISELFHKSCGFREEERVICFVKDVG